MRRQHRVVAVSLRDRRVGNLIAFDIGTMIGGSTPTPSFERGDHHAIR